MKNLLSLPILLIAVCLLLSSSLNAQESKTVDVATAGTLPTLITASEKDQITHLTVTGNLNGTDIRFIREMAGRNMYKKETSGKLSVLDLSQANIVSGGDYYGRDNFLMNEQRSSIYKTTGNKASDVMYKSGSESAEDRLPNNLRSGGKYAYERVKSLSSMTVRDNVTLVYNTTENVIGDCMFQSCTGLTEIILPASITSIGKYAFELCSGLTSVSIPDNVTSIDTRAFRECLGLTSLTIGNNVTSIGVEAFQSCQGITSVTIPNSVTSIKEKAFSSCSGLTSVTIGSGVTSIGKTAFSRCKRIKEFRVSEENSSYCQVEDVLYNKDKTTLIACPGTKTNEYIIPNSVTSIGEEAFAYCVGLTSITIPNSVTSIGHKAFFGCDSLTSIAIPQSVTSIGEYAFAGCDGLTSITIPNRVTSIGNGAFSNCVGLTSITIPKSVTSIGSYAFSRSSFMEIYCEALTPPTLGRSDPIIFDNFSNDNNDAYYAFLKTCKIFVPKGTAAAYKNAGQWKKFSIFIEE